MTLGDITPGPGVSSANSTNAAYEAFKARRLPTSWPQDDAARLRKIAEVLRETPPAVAEVYRDVDGRTLAEVIAQFEAAADETARQIEARREAQRSRLTDAIAEALDAQGLTPGKYYADHLADAVLATLREDPEPIR